MPPLLFGKFDHPNLKRDRIVNSKIGYLAVKVLESSNFLRFTSEQHASFTFWKI